MGLLQKAQVAVPSFRIATDLAEVSRAASEIGELLVRIK